MNPVRSTAWFLVSLPLAALLSVTPVHAQSERAEDAGWSGVLLYRHELTAEAFPEAKRRIEQLFAPGEIHARLAQPQQNQVRLRLDAIEQLLATPQAAERHQQAMLERRLREINEILVVSTRISRDSDVQCRRTRRAGSRLPDTVCFDRQEMEAQAALDRDLLNHFKCRSGGARVQIERCW